MTTIETIREQLLTQDNRGTEHPVFVVEREELVYGVSRDYTDRTVPRDGGDGPSESRRVGVVGVWVFEAAYFTESAADRCVAENSHNGTFRVFVHSAHRNPEWQAVRAMLMGECAPSKLGHDPKVALMLLHEKAERSYGRGKIDGLAAGTDERVVLADRLRATRSERDELIHERDALLMEISHLRNALAEATGAGLDEIVSPPLREPVNSRPATKGKTLQRPPIVLPEQPDYEAKLGRLHNTIGRLEEELATAKNDLIAQRVQADMRAAQAGQASLWTTPARVGLPPLAEAKIDPSVTREQILQAADMARVFGAGIPPLCDYCKGAILPGARVHVEGGKAWHGCQHHAPKTHARYLDAWTAADGVVLWWTELEPKVQYLGTPLDDDFPDHVTHWTAVVSPSGFEPAGAWLVESEEV